MSDKQKIKKNMTIALAWCLAWGENREPQQSFETLARMRQNLTEEKAVPPEVSQLVSQVQQLQNIDLNYHPEKVTDLEKDYPELSQQTTSIGLVYGGATKIKSYVFTSAKLPEIRGASALLDRINLVDLPAFFGQEPDLCQDEPDSELSQGLQADCQRTRDWLDEEFPQLKEALIPELIIYSTGGNLLAFCPAAYVNDLANAIEKRYTTETITANSCAVGDTFSLLEFRFGLLQNPLEKTLWLDWYRREHQQPLVEAYFGKVENESDLLTKFFDRKSFNELAGKLATLFNQRRSGNDTENRPTRRYPPMLETHPYLIREEGDKASAVVKTRLPGEPYFSENLARKRIMGQRAKQDKEQSWYRQTPFSWEPGEVESWVNKFTRFLAKDSQDYYKDVAPQEVKEALSLEEISNVGNKTKEGKESNESKGYLSFIYADGNNMGGYIQKIKTPEEYQQFSADIFEATEQSVYYALRKHLRPHKLKNLSKLELQNREGIWVHPFEIITIGGDDVLLIVPANKALKIAKTIGEEFERILIRKKIYNLSEDQLQSDSNLKTTHRYQPNLATSSRCQLSISSGVLTIAYDTPVYYAENLTNQLLKSAKKKAKSLKKCKYYGGTVDFLTLKSVTMISSNIESFREEGLIKKQKGKPTLKLYATPYTLHELGGIIETAEALKESEFPRSQLYQIRSLLAHGKRTAMLNYRYFRVRLQKDQQQLLTAKFEEPWCPPKDPDNNGNLAPWMLFIDPDKDEKSSQEKEPSTYETIWRELVDIYPFIEVESETKVGEKVNQ
ncbi:MAG: type III-B CRISPR-associated protein Cas10/Cmr2 [Oscillatoria sp. PMC 1068.18]|nr:type III-B CRISPR-associated protein Cas10/Cmr2 [Oscillatoria sp. PMC 1076.18]MEC4988459.1 type III-B CRISPR-associated protein Cas10/Cmr2 [Oscillatoria sp. PMC 1068.18]